ATPGSGLATIDYSVNGAAFQPYTAPVVIGLEGTTQITARATDTAGNVENAPATILIDASAPIVAITSPQAGAYLHSDTIALSFSATDAVSGLQSLSGTLDGAPVQSGQPMPLLTLALGDHTLSVAAVDVAGNQTTQSQPFSIVATVDSLIAAVNIFGDQGR